MADTVKVFRLEIVSRRRARKVIYTNKWLPDDGQPGLAFIAKIRSLYSDETVSKILYHPTVWVASCNCKTFGECPASIGANECCERWGVANIVRREGINVR